MLAFVREAGLLTDRKARLFSVAVCRRIRPPLADERGRTAVAVAERYADAEATEAELRRAHNAFHADTYMLREASSWWGQRVLEFMHKVGAFFDDHWAYDFPPTPPDRAIIAASSRKAVKGAALVLREAMRAPKQFSGPRETTRKRAVSALCDLFRDLVGNPLRPPRPLDPPLLTWRGGTVVKLAEAIYQGSKWADMPILADTLEEAGCTDADLLGHLRSPAVHVRGCFAVDAVLRKE
jgi:hypothetical protein